MSVRIKRKTGILGMGANISVKVNGEKVTKIAYEEDIELDIKNANALLRVSQFGAHSNQIEVEDGDVIEVKTTKIAYIAFFLPFLYLIANTIVPMVPYIMNNFILVLLLMLFIFFTFNGYRLNVIDRKNSREHVSNLE